MLTTIALAMLAGVPGQPAELKLTNVRMTVGELGPPRDGNKLLPGDVLFIAYDIEGLTINPDGTTKYMMAMEVTDAAGKVILKQDPRELDDFIPLRGNKIPARAFINAGLDQPAGSYTCKITVTDPKTKASGSLTAKFEVTKKDFGIVIVYTSYDSRGEISAPTTGQVGQMVYVQFSIASFERDPKTKQPHVEIEFQIYDEKGFPTLGKPPLGEPRKHIQDAKSVPAVKEGDGVFALQFPLFMNRPGKFTVQITATDKVNNKTATYKLPVTVLPAN
jgi:hypothetical protein